MNLQLRRVIVFVQDVQMVGVFYRDVLGLPVVVSPDDEREWLELDAGGCRIGLHKSDAVKVNRRQPKLVFYAENVASARDHLIARGAKLGAVQTSGEIQFCDGKNPEGNPYQISNRP
jgi:catechol 2,3-dioxygenase-like lactoylglutathione lyase family enzyme